MKHTKGKWTIKFSKESAGIEANDGHGIIARLKPRYSKTNNFEEFEANAKLIVAAPELLEALKQFIHSVEHEGAVNGRIVDAVRNAKDIIKKATN